MKLLLISLDKTVFEGRETLKRFHDYAERLASLDVLVFSPNGRSGRIGKVGVYGSGGKSKLAQLWQGIKQAKGLATGTDLVSAQDPFFTGLAAYLAARANNIRFTVDVHGDFFNPGPKYFPPCPPRRRGWGGGSVSFVHCLLAKFIFKKAAAIRAVNPKIKDDIVKFGIPADKISVIPVPVDLAVFRNANPAKTQAWWDKFKAEPLLLYAGRLDKNKDVKTLIEAFTLIHADLPAARLVIAGDGPEFKNLRVRTDDLRLKDAVFFENMMNQADLAALYHAADIFVLPSKRESFGRVILEAAAAGTPVVATRTVGASFLLAGGRDGELVEPGDVAGLASAIKAAWKNYPDRKNKARELKEKLSQDFSYQRSVTNLINFWRLCISP